MRWMAVMTVSLNFVAGTLVCPSTASIISTSCCLRYADRVLLMGSLGALEWRGCLGYRSTYADPKLLSRAWRQLDTLVSNCSERMRGAEILGRDHRCIMGGNVMTAKCPLSQCVTHNFMTGKLIHSRRMPPQAQFDRQGRLQQPSLGVVRRCMGSMTHQSATVTRRNQLQLLWR